MQSPPGVKRPSAGLIIGLAKAASAQASVPHRDLSDGRQLDQSTIKQADGNKLPAFEQNQPTLHV